MAEQEVAPTLPEEEATPEPEVDIDGLVEQLKAAGVTTSNELEGKLKASHEAGRMAQLLGEMRDRNSQLEKAVQDLQNAPQRQPQNLDQDYMDNPAGQPIDIEAAIARASAKAVNQALDDRDRKMMESQRMFAERWQSIQMDKDYKLVRDVWEEKAKDPQFTYQVQSGQVDPLMAYQETVRDFYKGLALKAAEGFQKLQGTTGPVEAPHTEAQGTVTAPPAVEESENQEKIKALKEKTEKGGLLDEETELDALAAVLQG